MMRVGDAKRRVVEPRVARETTSIFQLATMSFPMITTRMQRHSHGNMSGPISRRAFLGTAGKSALAAGAISHARTLLAQEAGERPGVARGVSVINPRGRVPVGIIIDDSTIDGEGDDGIDGGSGDNSLNINNSDVTGDDNGIDLGIGNDCARRQMPDGLRQSINLRSQVFVIHRCDLRRQYQSRHLRRR